MQTTTDPYLHRYGDAQTQFCLSLWNAKVGSQETPGVTGKFGLGVQNEAG